MAKSVAWKGLEQTWFDVRHFHYSIAVRGIYHADTTPLLYAICCKSKDETQPFIVSREIHLSSAVILVTARFVALIPCLFIFWMRLARQSTTHVCWILAVCKINIDLIIELLMKVTASNFRLFLF